MTMIAVFSRSVLVWTRIIWRFKIDQPGRQPGLGPRILATMLAYFVFHLRGRSLDGWMSSRSCVDTLFDCQSTYINQEGETGHLYGVACFGPGSEGIHGRSRSLFFL